MTDFKVLMRLFLFVSPQKKPKSQGLYFNKALAWNPAKNIYFCSFEAAEEPGVAAAFLFFMKKKMRQGLRILK